MITDAGAHSPEVTGSARLPRILVAEDEVALREFVSRNLRARGFTVLEASNGLEALAVWENEQLHLLILDVMMPRMDGLEVCRRVRERSTVPIIVLTALDGEADKVAALDLGADDYLTKPFGTDELMARVRALLRRSGGRGSPGPLEFRSGNLSIDLSSHRVSRDGEEIRLTRTEWSLVEALARHPGKLLTHGWLLEHVWGAGYEGDVEVLRVFISQLRRKIEADPRRPRIVVTEPGIGYRWILRPSESSG
jgi:two-component system KDP operon response regulator KdpE